MTIITIVILVADTAIYRDAYMVIMITNLVDIGLIIIIYIFHFLSSYS